MRIERGFILSTLQVWVILFAIVALWESVIRILIFHDSWNLGNSLFYVVANVIVSFFLALILGLLHALLLMMLGDAGIYRQRLRLLVSPTAAVAVAALLIAVALSWQIKNNTTLKSTLTVAIFLAIYLPCVILFGVLTRRVPVPRIWALRKKEIIIGLLLIPVIAMVSVQTVRSFKLNSQVSGKGAISRVILITIDTLRYDYVGAYGSTAVHTPVIDSIASEGALYKFALTLVGETNPSHISMFTGEYPWVYGIFHNGLPLSRKASTLTQYFRNVGYHTGAFISGLPLKSYLSGLDRGFETYDDRLALKDFFRESFVGRVVGKAPFFLPGKFRQAKEVTDASLQWLHKNAGSPFFLWVHYYDVHYPYGIKDRIRSVADPFLIKAKPSNLPVQKKLYAKEVESVDAQIGRLKQFLQQRGIYDKTLVIVTSDHGEGLGEHNYYYDHGDFVYDQLLRVPLIIRCPAVIKPGSVVNRQVLLLDLYKTILAATGVPAPKKAKGYNLIELAERMPDDYDRAFPSDSWEAIGVRTQGWKFIRNKKKTTVRYELYDLVADPGETINRFEIEKAKALEMRKSMAILFGSIQPAVRHYLSEEQLEELKSLGYSNQ